MGVATWVDTHGHLFLLDDDPTAVLDRAAAAGVRWVVCPGVDVTSSERSRELAGLHPASVKWSAGLHPHDAEMWPEVGGRIAELAALADAVGECGLDWYRNLAPVEAQRIAFAEQLELAVSVAKPIIIHCRDAFTDVYEALADVDMGERAVLHCWTGGRKWTKRFSELGVTFSFAGPLTYPTAETLRLAAEHAPPDRTLLETDAPYLAPEPKRGEPNEPANIPITGAALASVWGVAVEEVAALTTANAERIFGSFDD